jgi:hypothetical protein
MSLPDFFSRFTAWRKQSQLVSHEKLNTALSDSQKLLERNLVKKGRLMLKQFEYLNEKEEQCRKEREELKLELMEFSEQKICTKDLFSGEQLNFDLSQGKLWQQFSQELQALLGNSSPAMMKLRKAPVLKPTSIPPIPLLALKKEEPKSQLKQLYDVRHLEQESDELLHYL